MLTLPWSAAKSPWWKWLPPPLETGLRSTENGCEFSCQGKKTVVRGSLVIPTIVTQLWFQPREVGLEREVEFAHLGTAERFLHMPED